MESNKSAAHADEFRLVLSPNRGAGFRARQAVRQRFRPLPEGTRRDLVVVINELVNNAVEYGPGRPITVTIVVGEESIRGEVVDQGNPAAAIPQIRERTESNRGGLGLVDKLTAQWAVYEGSTHVWFEIPLNPD